MILILTAADDQHANHVESKLRERGASLVRFDPADFPRHAAISHRYSRSGWTTVLSRENKEDLDLRNVDVVWYRRPKPPVAHPEIIDESLRRFVEQECANLLHDVWRSLDCRWLPGLPFSIRQADLKAWQLKQAAALGFELPPTLFTTHAEDALELYQELDGSVVSKLAGPSFFGTLGAQRVRYTEMVTRRDLMRASDLRYCPVILQGRIEKAYELRITVVGDSVFAARIYSQNSNHTRLDWRHYDDYQTPYSPCDLPAAVGERCVALVKALGLSYGAIDMIYTPDGRYVFVEINSNGQYLWIEHETGLPISDAICDFLMAAAPRTGAHERESLRGAL